MAKSRNGQLGPAARPVAVPEDLDGTRHSQARHVQLPFHIRWSGPAIVYDLALPRDKVRVYEQVLREGTEDDVRQYIDPDELLDLWDRLVLPAPVRNAWSSWFRRHRGVDLTC